MLVLCCSMLFKKSGMDARKLGVGRGEGTGRKDREGVVEEGRGEGGEGDGKGNRNKEGLREGCRLQASGFWEGKEGVIVKPIRSDSCVYQEGPGNVWSMYPAWEGSRGRSDSCVSSIVR